MDRDQKLERLRNRSTKYELVVEAGGVRALAGYTRKGRPGLLAMLRQNNDAWTERLGDDIVRFGTRSGAASMTAGRFHIYFSGRTQREAILEGEMPWFKDVL